MVFDFDFIYLAHGQHNIWRGKLRMHLEAMIFRILCTKNHKDWFNWF